MWKCNQVVVGTLGQGRNFYYYYYFSYLQPGSEFSLDVLYPRFWDAKRKHCCEKKSRPAKLCYYCCHTHLFKTKLWHFIIEQELLFFLLLLPLLLFYFLFFGPCGWTARSEQIPVEYAMMWEDGIVWLYLPDPIWKWSSGCRFISHIAIHPTAYSMFASWDYLHLTSLQNVLYIMRNVG